jgi:hypothetical protein
VLGKRRHRGHELLDAQFGRFVADVVRGLLRPAGNGAAGAEDHHEALLLLLG